MLNLANTNIGNDGVGYIEQALSQNKDHPLILLDLSHNEITQLSAVAIGNLMKLENLKDLIVKHNKIGDKGLDEVCRVYEKNESKIKHLNLSQC
jgi:Leucine-rich repeat (LRR) protein